MANLDELRAAAAAAAEALAANPDDADLKAKSEAAAKALADAETAAAAEAEKAKGKGKSVTVRVLIDIHDYRCNQVVTLSEDEAAEAVAAGWADDDKAAVAFARKQAKAEEAGE